MKCFENILGVVSIYTNLLISLASPPGIANGSDDPWSCKCCMAEEAWATRHGQTIWVRSGVWIRHRGNYSGLNHPLQVLTGSYGINSWNKGTARAGHFYSVLLWRKKRGLYKHIKMVRKNFLIVIFFILVISAWLLQILTFKRKGWIVDFYHALNMIHFCLC